MFFYLFLRETQRQSVSRGGAERETQNLKQAPGSELDVGLKLLDCEIRT